MSGSLHINELANTIFNDLQADRFNEIALEIFRFQYGQNPVYREYIQYLGTEVPAISHWREIPFLPIGFFKSHKVVSGSFADEMVFSSSGTSGMQASHHHVKEISLYESSFIAGFRKFYGDPEDYCILALLPAYLEREGSSLVYMVSKLIEAGNHPLSGFFLDEYEQLAGRLKNLHENGTRTLVIGVSFALLDLAKEYPMQLGDHITIMETGGMKGRKEEITREELHLQLKTAFGKKKIHSEYGMTELFSQAYSTGNGKFNTPPWMKVVVRDIQDPFSLLPEGRSGALNIVDLANIYSCAFIETQDIGRKLPDGSFEVLGRTDHSDVRGCSLLIK